MDFAERERNRLAIGGAGFPRGDAHVDEIAFDAAAVGEQDAADDGRCDGRGVEVGAALEAMAGVGVEAVTACGAADCHWLEPRGFDEDVLGVGRDHGVPATHDAGEAERLDVIGDDEVFGIEGALDAVEGLEFFAFAGAADDDAAFDLVEVEGVGGLAHGEPCEVGGVDGVGDLLLLEKAEVGGDFGAGEPVARVADGDVAEDAGGEAAAGVFGFDLDGEGLRGRVRGGKRRVERLESNAVDGCGFAGDAVVVHGVDAVGGDVHLVERAVAGPRSKMPSTAMPRRVRSSASWVSETASSGR